MKKRMPDRAVAVPTALDLYSDSKTSSFKCQSEEITCSFLGFQNFGPHPAPKKSEGRLEKRIFL